MKPAITTARFGRAMVLAAIFLVVPKMGTAQLRERAAGSAAVDSIVEAALKEGKAAGMSIAVVRGKDTLVLRGYGSADLEHDVPTPERAVYEIGSVTKQFTAVAVLQLVAQGKLGLDDELTKYLPDYPTRGHRVTIRRLLDHTSGIRGYTEIPRFESLSTRKLPRDSLVALFGGEPFDFAPGDALVYNNSAYFLLGLVIEKVSGSSYAEYVQKNLFAPAGMRDSHYCSERAVVKRRAHGYDMGPDGQLLRAQYVDHTWPFSAGSLCSTAGDLAAWLHALHTGRLLSPAMYKELTTPGALNDGTRVRYAKGLTIDSIAGRRAIHHGGGIPGFLSQTVYFPDDDLTVVVLINTIGPVSPDQVAESIATAVLGLRPAATTVTYRGDLAQFAGEYKGVGRGRPLSIRIAAGNGTLTAQTGTGKPRPLRYVDGLTFQPEGSRTRLTFLRDGGRSTGRVTALRNEGLSVVSLLRRQ